MSESKAMHDISSTSDDDEEFKDEYDTLSEAEINDVVIEMGKLENIFNVPIPKVTSSRNLFRYQKNLEKAKLQYIEEHNKKIMEAYDKAAKIDETIASSFDQNRIAKEILKISSILGEFQKTFNYFKCTKIGERFDQTEKTINSFQNLTIGKTQKIDGLQNQLTSLQTTLNGLSTRIKGVETAVADQKALFERMGYK